MSADVLIARVACNSGAVADVMLWPGYGFVCPRLVTTNGNVWMLLSALRAWDRPGHRATSRWEPVHPDAPTHGATIEEVVRALAKIAGQEVPHPDILAAHIRHCGLTGATLWCAPTEVS